MSRVPAVLSALLAALLLAAPAAPAAGGGARAKGARATVALNGETQEVSWSDGDTFRVTRGRDKGLRARLAGINTLETWGPVQFWGAWDRHALLAFAKTSKTVCASASWECTWDGRKDRYERALVRCPALERELVRGGHAMVFAVDGPADPVLLGDQRDAQRRRAGMWAHGVPPRIVASAHSRSEEGGGYDRLVDTRSGAALVERHDREYTTCEEVCAGTGADRACFVYVPAARRFRNRPPCLAAPRKDSQSSSSSPSGAS